MPIEQKIAVCPKCGYTWEPRINDPKSCPRCKTRLDSLYKISPKLPPQDPKTENPQAEESK